MIPFSELSIREVSRHYGRRRALTRVSIDARAGEIVGLLGPNGAGKSTLLSIAATLTAPSSGEVRYGPRTAAECGPGLRSQIGVLSHDLQLYSELTAHENLLFFARLYRVSDPPAAAARALERASLIDRADDVVQSFSRGMRQRLALERALLHQPALLLLDEPFTGLDETSAVALVGRLKELRADRRIVLIATHDLDTAEAILDRAIVLREGRVVATETSVRGLRHAYRAHLSS